MVQLALGVGLNSRECQMTTSCAGSCSWGRLALQHAGPWKWPVLTCRWSTGNQCNLWSTDLTSWHLEHDPSCVLAIRARPKLCVLTLAARPKLCVLTLAAWPKLCVLTLEARPKLCVLTLAARPKLCCSSEWFGHSTAQNRVAVVYSQEKQTTLDGMETNKFGKGTCTIKWHWYGYCSNIFIV